MSRRNKINKERKIRLSLLVVSLVMLTFLIWYLHFSEPNLKPSDLIKIITGCLVVVGLAYSILSCESTQIKNNYDINRQRTATSFELANQWYKSPLIDYEQEVGKMERDLNFELSLTNINAKIKERHEIRVAITGIFNYFESICAALEIGLLDDSFCKRYFLAVFLHYPNLYLPYITFRREQKNDVNMWKDYTNIIERWIEEMK